MVVLPPPPLAGHPLDQDLPAFLRLPNIAADHTPVRVGMILPFGSGAAATRNLAAAMLNAAELALFDAKNPDIVLMTADEGNGARRTRRRPRNKLLAQGAEVIIGPLFGPSVSAVAPIARDRGVPVLAFSTEKSVAGNGVYLLSFLPQSEVARVVRYAVAQGHHNLAAMVPQNDYGDVVAGAFNDAVKAAGANSVGCRAFHAQCRRGDGAVPGHRQKQCRCGDHRARAAPILRAIAPISGLQRPGHGQGEIAGHRALVRSRD